MSGSSKSEAMRTSGGNYPSEQRRRTLIDNALIDIFVVV